MSFKFNNIFDGNIQTFKQITNLTFEIVFWKEVKIIAEHSS